MSPLAPQHGRAQARTNGRRTPSPVEARKRGLALQVTASVSVRIHCPGGDVIMVHRGDSGRQIVIDAPDEYTIDRVEPRRRSGAVGGGFAGGVGGGA